MRNDDAIIDAEFETIGPTPDEAATRAPDAVVRQTRPDDAARAGLGLFEGVSESRHGRPMPTPVFAMLAIILPLAAFLLAGGHVLLPNPATASMKEPQVAVMLDAVSTRVDSSGARPVLVVRGTLVNPTSQDQPVPPVWVMTDQAPDHGTPVHAVSRVGHLAPGARLAFTSRLPAGDSDNEPRIEIGHR